MKALVLASLCLVSLFGTYSQAECTAKALMEPIKKLGSLKPHEALNSIVGKWDAVDKTPNSSGAPKEMSFSAADSALQARDGENVTSVMAFDAKKFVMTTCDNAGTKVETLPGTYDEKSKTFQFSNGVTLVTLFRENLNLMRSKTYDLKSGQQVRTKVIEYKRQ
jgi:hypothetical protein